MSAPPKASKDDTLKRVIMNDFSGGLNVYKGILSLGPTESPDMLNVVPVPGRLQYRGGWTPFSSLPFPADEAYQFYDSAGSSHFAVWAGGNLYDCINGSPVLIVAAVYTAGARVGRVELNGILYWSTQTVVLQFWNPTIPSFGPVPQTGPSPPPSSPYLTSYTNAIVAGGVNFTGSPSGYQPNVFAWSAINQPGNWTAANSQAVGPNDEGHIEFITQFGIAEIGVAPFRCLIVGRADMGIYAYTGALGSLSEAVINCPVGCLDSGTVQFLPTAQSFGALIFLATDGQVWSTNGITASPVSLPILPILGPAIQLALLNNPNQRFWSGYNQKLQYYFCDIAGTQYVYKWDTGAWSKFQGWPSGPVFNVNSGGTINFGVPTMYVASNAPVNAVVAKVAVDGAFDNNTPPNVYWKSAFLHMGDPMRFKEFNWVAPFFYNTNTTYTVGAMSMLRADGSSLTSRTLTFNTPNFSPIGNIFTLDQSLLDGPDVLAGNSVSVLGAGLPMMNFGRLSVSAVGTGVLNNYQGAQQMQGGAVQFTISYASGTMDFELVGLEVRYWEKGYLRDGGINYNPQGGISGQDAIIGVNP